MLVKQTPRWTLYLHMCSRRPSLVRYVNLGVGYLTPGLTEDLGNMIERGQQWDFTSLEDANPVPCADIPRLPVGWAHDMRIINIAMERPKSSSKVICNNAGDCCGTCSHAVAHDHVEGADYGDCREDSICFSHGWNVHCVPVDLN